MHQSLIIWTSLTSEIKQPSNFILQIEKKTCLETASQRGNFSATQILREINFGHFEDPKTAI